MRKTLGVAPTVWYNDAGGWTFGLRARTDYLDRFDLNEAWLAVSSGWGTDSGQGQSRSPAGGAESGPPPRDGRHPAGSASAGGKAGPAPTSQSRRRFRRSLADHVERAVGLSLAWVTVTAPVYVDTTQYDDAGTVELTATGRMIDAHRRAGSWR